MSELNIFEVSYEVSNKVGGIYAVIESKTEQMINYYDDRYYAIGFFNQQKAGSEFDEREPPPEIKKILEELEASGIICHYGVWLKPGNPKTILVDVSNFMKNSNGIKKDLWDVFKVDSLHSGYDFTEPVVWSYAVGMLLEKLIEVEPFKKCPSVAQFHEWLSGAGLLYIKKKNLKIGTVFTTHATMLGRSMAGSGIDLNKKVDEEMKIGARANIDCAQRYGVLAKHTMETACAKNADVFSTVSEVTGRESEYILDKKPDIILPNGMDIEKIPNVDKLSVSRKKIWDKMKRFLNAYFSRYYEVDFETARVIYISGRYEFHNKGIDRFIEALGKLNTRLKEEKATRAVIAFIWIPTGICGVNLQVLEDITFYNEMRKHAEEILPHVEERIIKAWSQSKIPENLTDENFLKVSKKIIYHLHERKGRTPRLCAFDLSYLEQNDTIIQFLKFNGLLNREEDKVKVIFYPAYLSSTDGLLGLDYYEATMPCTLGVFPSYYEPWGYTPLECATMGIPSVTSDLSGFGKFIKDHDGKGIYVLKMENRSDKQITEDLSEIMYTVSTMPTNELVNMRMQAKELSYMADWKSLINNYIKAYNIALGNMQTRTKAE